jgi:hypothetical protein
MLHITPVQTTAQLQTHSPHVGRLGNAKVINGCPNRDSSKVPISKGTLFIVHGKPSKISLTILRTKSMFTFRIEEGYFKYGNFEFEKW